MQHNKIRLLLSHLASLLLIVMLVSACAQKAWIPPYKGRAPDYIIGPGDSVNIFVWGNPELTATVPVRPDGKITTPLVEDVQASGKTPTQLARDMEKKLAKYIRNPTVNVIVTGFVGRHTEQIRVVGEAAQPQALQYKEKMSLLDVIIAVGGLTEFAAGNKATFIRCSRRRSAIQLFLLMFPMNPRRNG